MTAVLNSIEQTLFFSDVPEGTLKPRENDAGILGAISDTFFFSDLISVANQSTAKSKRSASPDAISQVRRAQERKEGSEDSTVKIQNQTQKQRQPSKNLSKKAKLYKKVFTPLSAKDAVSVGPNESPLQTKSRGMTIAPPALARLKKQEKKRLEAARLELEEQAHELHVKEYSRKLRHGEL